MPRSLPSSLRVRSGGGAGSSSLSAGTWGASRLRPQLWKQLEPRRRRRIRSGVTTRHAQHLTPHLPKAMPRQVHGETCWAGAPPGPSGLSQGPGRTGVPCPAAGKAPRLLLGCSETPSCPRVVGAGLRAQGWRSLWRARCAPLLVRPGARPCPEEARLQAEWRRDRGRHQERPCEGVLASALSLGGEQGLGSEAPPLPGQLQGPCGNLVHSPLCGPT